MGIFSDKMMVKVLASIIIKAGGKIRENYKFNKSKGSFIDERKLDLNLTY